MRTSMSVLAGRGTRAIATAPGQSPHPYIEQAGDASFQGWQEKPRQERLLYRSQIAGIQGGGVEREADGLPDGGSSEVSGGGVPGWRGGHATWSRESVDPTEDRYHWECCVCGCGCGGGARGVSLLLPAAHRQV